MDIDRPPSDPEGTEAGTAGPKTPSAEQQRSKRSLEYSSPETHQPKSKVKQEEFISISDHKIHLHNLQVAADTYWRQEMEKTENNIRLKEQAVCQRKLEAAEAELKARFNEEMEKRLKEKVEEYRQIHDGAANFSSVVIPRLEAQLKQAREELQKSKRDHSKEAVQTANLQAEIREMKRQAITWSAEAKDAEMNKRLAESGQIECAALSRQIKRLTEEAKDGESRMQKEAEEQERWRKNMVDRFNVHRNAEITSLQKAHDEEIRRVRAECDQKAANLNHNYKALKDGELAKFKEDAQQSFSRIEESLNEANQQRDALRRENDSLKAQFKSTSEGNDTDAQRRLQQLRDKHDSALEDLKQQSRNEQEQLRQQYKAEAEQTTFEQVQERFEKVMAEAKAKQEERENDIKARTEAPLKEMVESLQTQLQTRNEEVTEFVRTYETRKNEAVKQAVELEQSRWMEEKSGRLDYVARAKEQESKLNQIINSLRADLATQQEKSEALDTTIQQLNTESTAKDEFFAESSRESERMKLVIDQMKEDSEKQAMQHEVSMHGMEDRLASQKALYNGASARAQKAEHDLRVLQSKEPAKDTSKQREYQQKIRSLQGDLAEARQKYVDEKSRHEKLQEQRDSANSMVQKLEGYQTKFNQQLSRIPVLENELAEKDKEIVAAKAALNDALFGIEREEHAAGHRVQEVRDVDVEGIAAKEEREAEQRLDDVAPVLQQDTIGDELFGGSDGEDLDVQEDEEAPGEIKAADDLVPRKPPVGERPSNKEINSVRKFVFSYPEAMFESVKEFTLVTELMQMTLPEIIEKLDWVKSKTTSEVGGLPRQLVEFGRMAGIAEQVSKDGPVIEEERQHEAMPDSGEETIEIVITWWKQLLALSTLQNVIVLVILLLALWIPSVYLAAGSVTSNCCAEGRDGGVSLVSSYLEPIPQALAYGFARRAGRRPLISG